MAKPFAGSRFGGDYLLYKIFLYRHKISFPPGCDIGENDYFLFVFLSNSIIEKDIYHQITKPRILNRFRLKISGLNIMQTTLTDSMTVADRSKFSFGDYAALAIASCGGIGYFPIVPATFGSLFAVPVFFIMQSVIEAVWKNSGISSILIKESFETSITATLLLLLFVIGIKTATRAEKITGRKDPRIVVIDELVGQLITFLFIPAKMGWAAIFIGFLAFRFFDIWKLYPADVLESLPSGLGAMADDAMAGVYAGVSMSLLCTIYLFI